ncbi:MAG: winged helix-turn-helix domain-containing protein [Salibacteraceae bacterium]|mgnify:CR=1 FL=1
MKEIIHKLDKTFESRIRLGLMSVLVMNEWVDFGTLKELLEVTDGNLASHVNSLEKKKYVEVRKQFIGRKPNTSFRATSEGTKAFQDHLKALEALLKSNNSK